MSPTTLVLVSTIVVLIVALSLRSNGKRSISKHPPGYMSWPLIGETISFLKPHSTTTLGEFMEHRISRFGRIFSSNLFGNPTIVSGDAELNRFISKNDMKLFGICWPRSFTKAFGGLSVSFVDGETHKHMRSMILNFLSYERLQTLFLKDAEELASLCLGSWKEGTVISAKDEATRFSFNIMVKNILSMEPGEPGTEKLGKEYEAFMTGLVCLPINFPGTAYWQSLKAGKNILKIIKQNMDERMWMKRDGDKGMAKDDFLGWFMGNTDYSWDQIGSFLLHMLFAGHDTSSRAISLAIYFLHGCREAIEQLREEHLQAMRSKKHEGKSQLTWDDYKQMQFTQCVINETLRLGNIASFTTKKANTNVSFKGYEIPRGSIVMVHSKAMHLDPSLFEDPERFNPWRWLGSSGIKKSNNFMPFGGGARLCPGAELARLEMMVFLHHLVINYDWELIELDHPVHIPYVDFLKGLPIKVQALSPDSHMA